MGGDRTEVSGSRRGDVMGDMEHRMRRLSDSVSLSPSLSDCRLSGRYERIYSTTEGEVRRPPPRARPLKSKSGT